MRARRRLEDEGHRILKLNIGNPAPFGFEAPDEILIDMIHNSRMRRATATPRDSIRRARRSMQYASSCASRTSTSTTSTSATASAS